MAKPTTKKVQVVDLGTHFLKAVVAEVGPDGINVLKATAVPLSGQATETDAYFNEVAGAFSQLVEALERKIPVTFLAGENIIKTGVSYLNNVSADTSKADVDADRSKFVSTYGGSAYEQKIDRSFRLRERGQGKALQLIAAHSYVKMLHIDAIQEMCAKSRMSIGGVYPRLFALERLFHLHATTDAAMAAAVAVVIDVGFSSTSIAAFKDGTVVFYKVLHVGASDVLRGMVDAARGSPFRPDANTLVLLLSTGGVAPDPDAISKLGAGAADPAKIAHAVTTELEEILQKIQLSVDYFSTVAATDFNTSMSTVMAVRKGPEVYLLTGGVSASAGFLEVSGQAFAKPATQADPTAFARFASPPELPSVMYGPAIAAASIAADEARADLNLADLYKAKESALARAVVPGGDPSFPGWALAVVSLMVVGTFGYGQFVLGPQVKQLQTQESGARAQLAEAFDTAVKFRDARLKEQLSMLQVDYVRELQRLRFDWPTFYAELAGKVPDGIKLTRVTVNTKYPRSSDRPEEKDKNQSKEMTVRICGEAQEDRLVPEFVDNLQKTGHFTDIPSPEMTFQAEGASGGGSCQPPETESLKLLKHHAFTITAKLKF